MTASAPIFELRNLAFSWPDAMGNAGRGKPVFRDLNFSLTDSEKIGLYGPNGCGKTTLLKLITGLLTPQAGDVCFEGTPVKTEAEFRSLRCAVGYVLQNAEDQLFFPEVIEDVSFGPLNLGRSQAEALKDAEETLETLGLSAFAHRSSDRLSGGEKKLVSIATVLAMKPRALLLDEPTTGLDEKAREQLIHVLKLINLPRIVVSHDWDFLMEVSDTFATSESKPEGGQVVACGKPETHIHRHTHPGGFEHHNHEE